MSECRETEAACNRFDALIEQYEKATIASVHVPTLRFTKSGTDYFGPTPSQTFTLGRCCPDKHWQSSRRLDAVAHC